jgi:hypothetical protein
VAATSSASSSASTRPTACARAARPDRPPTRPWRLPTPGPLSRPVPFSDPSGYLDMLCGRYRPFSRLVYQRLPDPLPATAPALRLGRERAPGDFPGPGAWPGCTRLCYPGGSKASTDQEGTRATTCSSARPGPGDLPRLG